MLEELDRGSDDDKKIGEDSENAFASGNNKHHRSKEQRDVEKKAKRPKRSNNDKEKERDGLDRNILERKNKIGDEILNGNFE